MVYEVVICSKYYYLMLFRRIYSVYLQTKRLHILLLCLILFVLFLGEILTVGYYDVYQSLVTLFYFTEYTLTGCY